MDEQNEPGRIRIRTGDGCLVIALGLVATLTFGALAMSFHDKENWERDLMMVVMTHLLWTLVTIFMTGILVVLFKPRWLEKVLLRTFLKLMAIVIIVVVLLFWFAR